MLTDAYGVVGWVGLKYQNAYGCLRWVWVGGSKNIKMPTDAYGCGGWRVWFDFDPKQFQFLQP